VSLAAGAGSWTSLSDSTTKRRLGKVNTCEILNKVCSLPIERWSYKTQDERIQHIGPMSQDFYTVFEIGEDDKTITTVDPDGVALAAIQELAKQVNELRNENQQLRTQMQTIMADKKQSQR
jgi:hypothetical protein